MLPKLSEISRLDSVLSYIRVQSQGDIQLDPKHLPAVFALSALKTNGVYSDILTEVIQGQITQDQAYARLSANHDLPLYRTCPLLLKVNEAFITEVALVALGLSPDVLLPSAAARGHLDVVRALLESGCPKDSRGKALSRAANGSHLDVVQALLKSRGLGTYKQTLSLAVERGDIDGFVPLKGEEASPVDPIAAPNSHTFKYTLAFAVSAVAISIYVRASNCWEEPNTYFGFNNPTFEECFWGR